MSNEQRAVSGARTMMVSGSVGTSDGVGGAAGTDSDRDAAFQRFADLYLDASYRLANSILANPADAQDAVHDAFETAWRKWPTLRDPDRFDAWFRRIVVNTCRNLLKHRARRRAADIEDHVSLGTSDGLEHVAEQVVVAEGLEGLAPDDRVLIALRYSHDLALGDIAELMGIPSGTVKWRINRAHKRLRRLVERHQGSRDD